MTAQGFESGSVPSGQYVCGKVGAGFGHTGTHAAVGTYAGDGQAACWQLGTGRLNSREAEVSWWEYDESQGRFNDEMFLLRAFKNGASGNLAQEVIFDWFGYGPFNSTSAVMTLEPQTAVAGGVTTAKWKNGGTVDWGNWTQWEVHWKANDPGASNGDAEVYKNGKLVDQWTNGNFNGTLDMADQAIEIGGVYTKLTWWDGAGSFSPPGSCTTGIGKGQDNGPRVTDFSQACPCTNECPPNGHVPIFKRYFDDIVVLKK